MQSVDNLSGVTCSPERGVKGLAVPESVTQLPAVVGVSAAAGVSAGGCRVLTAALGALVSCHSFSNSPNYFLFQRSNSIKSSCFADGK